MLKKRFKLLFWITCILASWVCNVYAMSFTDFIYANASRGNVSAIKNYLYRGYNIDALDGNGMTALCYAVMRQDKRAYQVLKELGAVSDKDCMQRVNTMKQQKNPVRQQKVADTHTSHPSTRQNSSVSHVSDNTKYATIGILGAGAVTAAILLGGKSGGSHSHNYTPTCPEGQRLVDGVCVDIKNCPTGQKLVGDTCVDIVCPEGQHLEGDICVDDEPADCPIGQQWNGQTCVPIQCGPGQHLEGNTCVDNDTCPIGQRWDGVQCVDIVCEEGTHLEGDICVPDTPTDCPIGQRLVDGVCVDIICPENTHLVGKYCIADDIDKTHYGDDDIMGVYSNDELIYNLYSSPKYPDDAASIILKNTGHGNVYGMYGYGGDTEVFNAYVIGKSGDVVNRMPAGIANISITDNGHGDVYGMYSQISDITQYKEAINATAWNDGTATGNITINHTGGGKSLGILGDVRAYNTFIADGGTGYGNINITGDGDMYGISGYVATTNVVNYNNGKYGEGNINLVSTGNGDIYGMMVNKDDIPGAGAGSKDNIASWFSINSIVNWYGGGKTVGNINIHNIGSGNVYGMYGGQQLHNALSNDIGEAYGNINIVNIGNGNSYGMYMPEADDRGSITNASDNGGHSFIKMVNAGSGTATGMRGGRGSSLLNSGEISINNIGSGTAIGIYGEKNTKINNRGIINIYRSAYDDNGTIINPATTYGGKAYGIYAEEGATVDNSGDIIISGAGSGKGIYLETGATLTNTGTVVFNGISENTEGTNPSASTVVNLQDFGNGEIILAQSGKFFAESLSGNMGVSAQSTLGTMQNEYNLGNALQVNNVDNLNLASKSAMFEAQTVKNGTGYDVVLSRKNFNALVQDANLAEFFELNYQEGRNSALYDRFKAQTTAADLNNVANIAAGNNIIPSFRREDAQVYSNLSRQFNDNLFNHPEDKYIGGYKYIDISRNSDGVLNGNDGQANVAYGLLKNKANNGVTYGLGATVSQLKSDYDNGSKRRSNMFGLWVPIGYGLGENTRLVTKLYTGYMYGDYDRKSLNNKYSADIKSYQYGLSNEFRHNIGLSSGFKLIPAAELNLLGIYQKGFNEGSVNNALRVEQNNSLSLEGGLGAYLSKEFAFDADNKLGLQIGGIYYVEFGEPDKGLRASIMGMNHKYKIKHNFDDKRAVFSARVNYDYKNITIYGLIEQETGGYKAFNIDAGLQYNFK